MTSRGGPVKDMIPHKAVLFSMGLIGIVFLMVQCGPGLNAPGGSYPQIIVGASGFSGGNFQGKIYYFNSVNGNLEFSQVGETVGDLYGTSVSTAEDFNGDGFDDIVVGAVEFGTAQGKVYVYGGTDGAELLFSKTGEADFDRFGASVSTAGDFNGDGFDDIVVGATGFPGGGITGKVYVYAGPDGAELLFSKTGENPLDQFGVSVSNAGDFNRDGKDDIVVGSGANTSGKVYVYSGSDGTLLFSKGGETTLDIFGTSVASTRGLIKRIPKLPK